jgi:hypothetical protein
MTRAKRSGGMAQAGQHLTKHAQSPEFKPQYHIKRKKKKNPQNPTQLHLLLNP